jgi:DNA (cytosine-5)-methyltransferase 1
MYTFHLFAGAGGGILGDLLLGHTPIGAVEIETYPRKVLLQRQLDGILPVFPIWDDVTTFRTDNPETESFIGRLRKVNSDLAICGGFPCQDISRAGKGEGITGARSGLWREFARIIGEVRPRYAFIENSPMLVVRGLETVLCDLAALGYDARWGVVSAENAGALQERKRIWIVADSMQRG